MPLASDAVTTLLVLHRQTVAEVAAPIGLLGRWWTWLAVRLPAGVAPNLLTVLGTLAIVLPVALTLAAWPAMAGDLPIWLLGLQIVAVVAFQTLDGVDGIHARRTGSGSPLGSWLDSSLDMVSLQVMMLAMALTGRLGTGWRLWVFQAGALLGSIAVHWRTGMVGSKSVGNRTSVLKAQFLAIAIHLVALVGGSGTWARPLAGVPLGTAVLMISVVGLGGVTILGCLRRVVTAVRRGTAKRPVSAAISGCSAGLLLLAANAWLFAQVPAGSARLAVVLMAVCAGCRLASEQILHNLCDEAMPALPWDAAVYGVGCLVLASLVPPMPGVLWAAAAVTGVWLVAYIVRVARQLAHVLQIPILRLPR